MAGVCGVVRARGRRTRKICEEVRRARERNRAVVRGYGGGGEVRFAMGVQPCVCAETRLWGPHQSGFCYTKQLWKMSLCFASLILASY